MLAALLLDELLPERGFNVARALVGTESTCVTVTEVEIELMDGMYIQGSGVMLPDSRRCRYSACSTRFFWAKLP